MAMTRTDQYLEAMDWLRELAESLAKIEAAAHPGAMMVAHGAVEDARTTIRQVLDNL